MDLKQWRRGRGFGDFVFIKFWIIKYHFIFTVYFAHQIGIIIHVTIPRLDRFSAQQKLLVILFLPKTIREWNKLNTSVFQAPSYSLSRKALSDFIRPTANSTFETNVSGLRLLASLRVGFNHLREYKFKHNFQDTLNLLRPCSLEAKGTFTILWAAKFF